MIHRLIILSLLITIVTINSVHACLNGESKELKSGDYLYEDFEGRVPMGHRFFFRAGDPETDRIIRKLDTLYQVTHDLEYLSDKGVVLIVTGRYEEAIALYKEIERLQPGRYATASNIGTAYELTGKNEEALKWINRAIAINPASHRHSEWIHAAILEAKIKGASLINTRHLLQTDFGSGDVPVSTLTKGELDSLANAVYFQLNERISFVEPKDPIVAQLLHDLGDIEYLLNNKEDAKSDYQLAIRYGYLQPTREILQDTVATESVQEITEPEKRSTNKRFPVIISGATVVLLAVVILAARRRRLKEKNRPQ
jgi:tetratricopeptide (TPR) repeat protein